LCGQAGALVVTANPQCVPCIEGIDGGPLRTPGCCLVDQACSRNAACVALLQCTQACAIGDLACVGVCENELPTAVTFFNDFAMCVNSNCPMCPVITTTIPQIADR
jgi:hypothetical protein